MIDKSVYDLTDCELAKRKHEILSRVARDIEHGMTTIDALNKYKDEYIERTGSILTKTAVSEAFKNHGDKDSYARYRKELEKKVSTMVANGITVSEIAKELGVSCTTVRTLLRKAKPERKKVERVEDTFVLTEDMITNFKDSLNVGDTLQCKVSRTKLNPMGLLVTKNNDEAVVIKSKYTHFCETNKGTFRWADLYLFRRAREMA